MHSTWERFGVAVAMALLQAETSGERQQVRREDGEDWHGPYKWRVSPAGVAEPCS